MQSWITLSSGYIVNILTMVDRSLKIWFIKRVNTDKLSTITLICEMTLRSSVSPLLK